jgi:hypothetical protein
VTPRGLLHLADDPAASYLQIDATGLYASGDPTPRKNLLLAEFTRELVYLKPDTVVVYDRVQPASPETPFDWRVHFPAQPAASGATVRSTHGRGGVALALVAGDELRIVPDTDLAPDGSRAWRAQATSRTGRFLAVLRVGSGGAPELAAAAVATNGDMEGVVLPGNVVLFSKLPFGRAPGLGFRYAVPSEAGRVHTLVNMGGSVAIAVRREGRNTVVTVAAGTDRAASPEGIVRFTEDPPR